MSNGLVPSKVLVPLLDEETAKAIQETAKLGIDLNDTVQKIGGSLARVAGNLPGDLVGMVGDWVRHKRMRRWADLQVETIGYLKARGVQPPYFDISPSLAEPLIDAALDDTRDELKTLWARLLANALDPQKQGTVRNAFIDILKKLEPLDALMLQALQLTPGGLGPTAGEFMTSKFKKPQDEIAVSFQNLETLGLIYFQPADTPASRQPKISTLGSVFLRAVGQ